MSDAPDDFKILSVEEFRKLSHADRAKYLGECAARGLAENMKKWAAENDSDEDQTQ